MPDARSHWSDPLLSEAADWDLFDVNVRLGSSGVHGELSLDPAALIGEMDRYGLHSALVSHWTAEEYDAVLGNETLARDITPRLLPAWAILPEKTFLEKLSKRSPLAVRITPGPRRHNFSLDAWCAGAMLEFLEDRAIVSLISREDISWSEVATILEKFPRLPLVLLDTGYRADRYLFPLLERFPSLWLDTSTYLGYRQLESFVERFGPSRLLFGSRLPLYTPASAIGVLASARISDSDRRAIAGGNLRQLLALARGSSGEQE